MWKFGWVRYSEVRDRRLRQARGGPGLVVGEVVAAEGAPTAWTMSGRVRSSTVMPMRSSPTLRRLMPLATALRRIRPWNAPTRTVTVSKKCADSTAKPRLSRPCATRTASRWTRAAMAFRPRGPWNTAYMPAMTASSTWRCRFSKSPSRGGYAARGSAARAIGAVAARIHRDADEAPRHGALEGVAGGEVGGVRAAIAHGHAVALHRAHGDVGPPSRPGA